MFRCFGVGGLCEGVYACRVGVYWNIFGDGIERMVKRGGKMMCCGGGGLCHQYIIMMMMMK